MEIHICTTLRRYFSPLALLLLAHLVGEQEVGLGTPGPTYCLRRLQQVSRISRSDSDSMYTAGGPLSQERC